jgi:putative OPT family oligopeptide transporter
MTVSASIPAAVISMGVLRGILRTGTIHENNIVQTVASAGESIAGGIIFTIPALVILGEWKEFDYWSVTLIAGLGGILGVLFMVPLRRALIVEEKELVYPEGVACAEVLKAGETGGSGIGYVFGALLVGGGIKFFISGVSLFSGLVEGAWRWSRTAVYLGTDISPALLAVGYIIGMNVSFLVFLGGAIGWVLCIPGYYLFNGYPAGTESVLDTMYQTWSDQVRYIGVGSMIVGGLWSIISVRKGITKGFQGAIAAYRNRHSKDAITRTERDMDIRAILIMFFPTAAGIFLVYFMLTGSWSVSLGAGAIMVAASFFFVAVSSYIVGLVGSSNNPVSGMTISTMLFASSILFLFGMTGTTGALAALGISGVVCCAICTAGDVSQDLKTGQQIGATPRKQQWAQIIGVLVPVFMIAPLLNILHSTYGIGMQVKEGVECLKAPQANLFASIAKAIFHGKASMPWNMIWVGVGIGIFLIVLDEILRMRGSRFRAYVMPVAVGVYLPWSIDIPILLGGLAVWYVERSTANEEKRKSAIHRGVLVSSGLIAGESLMGVLVAILMFCGIKTISLGLGATFQNGLSLGMLLLITLGLIVVSRWKRK